MNRSTINTRMVPVLVAAIVVVVALMPSEVGDLFQRFGEVAVDAGHRVHDGYMRLFE